jgi:hypothetical protein
MPYFEIGRFVRLAVITILVRYLIMGATLK